MRKLALFVTIISLSLDCATCIAADGRNTTPTGTEPRVSRLEIFGGFSYLRMSNGLAQELFGLRNRMGTNGWAAGVTYNLTRYVGATAEFNGNYSSGFFGAQVVTGTHQHNFLFGPTAAYHNRSAFTPFAHGLFGVSHLSIPGLPLCPAPSNYALPLTYCSTVSQSSFAMVLGGGADVKLSKRLSIRMGQLDYVRTQHTLPMPYDGPMPTPQHHLRYSGGIVIKLF